MLNLLFKIKNFFQFNKVKALGVNQKIYKKNKIYLYDATTPNLVKEEQEPAPFQIPLGIRSIGESGGGFGLGTIQQQALSTKQIVNNAVNYFIKKTNKKIKRWSSVSTLTIMPRAGKDVNAYYDRSSLRFFYFTDTARKKTIYACDASPVITHELGHAFLDILRPDWWDVQAMEIWSFHEAFGDMFWLLSALQNDSLLELMINENNGDLSKSNIVTRLAADMARGLFNLTNGAGGVSQFYLRDLSMTFRYTQPELLPSRGNDNDLLNEPHSFSRVFSCAFYKLVIEIANRIKNKNSITTKESLKKAGDLCTEYLLAAVLICPTQARAFNAMANSLIIIDRNHGSLYHDLIQKAFQDCNIVKAEVTMLDVKNLDSFDFSETDQHQINFLSNKEMIVRKRINSTVKLSDHYQLHTLDTNFISDLMDLDIEIASEEFYHFDQDKNLVSMLSVNNTDALDAAQNCISFISENKLYGKDDKSLFDSDDGKLIRKQIICKCNKPNYCNPQAPEYMKPWKPKNNAGCMKCRSNCEPRSCDECDSTPPSPPKKLGCYTSYKSGSGKSYKVGSKISRKVC